LGEATYNEEIRNIVGKFFTNLKRYVEQYLGNEQHVKHLPVMIYALGMGLGIMWTIDRNLFDIDEMDESLKSLILQPVEGRKES
jgi:hypothetical protein